MSHVDLVFEIMTSSMVFLAYMAIKELSSHLKALASPPNRNTVKYKLNVFNICVTIVYVDEI